MDFNELGKSLTDAYNSIYEGNKSKKDHPGAKPNPKLDDSEHVSQSSEFHKAVAPGRTQNIERLMKRQPKLSRKQAEDMVDKKKSTNESQETTWLGINGFSRSDMASLSDAYKNMYPSAEVENKEVEFIVDSYAVSEENGQDILEGKKKCKEGYKYDSEKKKCVKKKKKSSSKTTVIIKNRGGGGYYGGLHGHGHGHGGGDGGDGETEGGGGEGGGDGGGGGE